MITDFRLKVFRAVAERLSFTRAADELFITQPAVTKHINELEKHYPVAEPVAGKKPVTAGFSPL